MNKKVDTYKIYRQLEERNKRANPYLFYDKDELIDEILKNEDELERYKNNIKSAFEVINTQMKNLSKEEAENLRIIKFNLIKGSCTFEDLKTEEDYKY